MSQVSQIPGESPRRYFADPEMDLTVWLDDRGGIRGFELCYDRGKNERALRWTRGAGFIHDRVDDGESRPFRHKGTPILVPDGTVDRNKISRRFTELSREMDQQLAAFVVRMLSELPL